MPIDAPCSGNGSCGKCRVRLEAGELDSYPTSHLSEEELEAGWRLACLSRIVGDVHDHGAGYCLGLSEQDEDGGPLLRRGDCHL